MKEEFPDPTYESVNADVIRNKRILKETGISPAQEAWKAANHLPQTPIKMSWWALLKFWWKYYAIRYNQGHLDRAYQAGYMAGRAFEYRTTNFHNAQSH